MLDAEKILMMSTAAMEHLKQGANGNALEILNAIKEDAKKEIRRAAAKASGNANRQKAAERVIKNAIASNPGREALHGFWIKNEKQYICDGFRILRLNNALPLPTISEKLQPIDADRILTPAKDNAGAVLELPDVGELRAYIKTEKARKKAISDKSAIFYDFSDDLPRVNAVYLLDMLEILPGCTATASSRGALVNPIYFESEHGDGVLCPVKKGN